MTKYNKYNLPSSYRFIAYRGDDGLLYDCTQRAMVADVIADLREEHYEDVRVISRDEMPSGYFRMRDVSLGSYTDAEWEGSGQMTIRIYSSMGVLAHEKSPVYTCNAPANNTPGLYDELTVELPVGWSAYETETDTVIVSPDGDKYFSYEILRDYGDAPALVWYDGETYHHKLLREVTPDA